MSLAKLAQSKNYMYKKIIQSHFYHTHVKCDWIVFMVLLLFSKAVHDKSRLVLHLLQLMYSSPDLRIIIYHKNINKRT